VDSLIQDLRYAIRTLTKSPGFTLVAVLTLALGIGATTAIFSAVSAVLLRPLPYPGADRLVAIWGARGADHQLLTAYTDVTDFRAQSGSFEGIGIIRGQSVNLTGRETPERLSGEYVTADVFAVLGARAALGRTFTADETTPGRGKELAVLSDAAWKGRFGGDRHILGSSVTLNGRPHVVIGVMPPGFTSSFGPVEVWIPITSIPSRSTTFNRGVQNVWGIGRMRPGVSVERAGRELAVIADRLGRQYPASNAGFGVSVIPLREQIAGPVKPALLTLLAAVGLVLLIACANVANLQLARAAARRHEISVRAALGAGRGRLARQLLTESLLLSAAGGVGGVLLAAWAVGALVRAVPGGLPAFGAVGLDLPVLLFTAGAVVASALLFGLAPAVLASRTELGDALRLRAPDGSTVRRGIDLRSGLVVVELALCMVLIASAGLLMRSVSRLGRVDPGFEPARLLTFQFRLPPAKYPDASSRAAFFAQAVEQVRVVPGVRTAALVSSTPMSGNWATTNYVVEGQPAPGPGQAPAAGWNAVSGGYFGTMRIPVVAGRDFDAHDRLGTLPVAIVSRELARRSWPGGSALGRRIQEVGDSVWRTVVGVVGDTKQRTLGEEREPRMYVPVLQDPINFSNVVARTVGDPIALVPAVRSAIWHVDPEQPVWGVTSMEQLLARSTWQARFTTLLTGGFAALALLLAAIGVYGVMSYAVVQRTREVGIRLAVGASPSQAVTLVLGRGIRMTVAATVLGLAGALAATRLLKGQLFGVAPGDPTTFAVAPAVLVLVALLACWLPARRAARVDPVVALRAE
jgi:putative ABC transport system permease protein